MGKVLIPFIDGGNLEQLTVAKVKKQYDKNKDQFLAGVLHGVKIGEGLSFGNLNVLIGEERIRVAQLKQRETDPLTGIFYFDKERDEKLKYTIGVLHGLQAVRASML